MDERRIVRALREGPPDEPAYQLRLGPRLAADAPASVDDAAFGGAVPPADVAVLRRRRASAVRFASTLAAAIAILAVALSFRFGAGPGVPSSAPPDLLGRLREQGSVAIVVTSGPPQTVAAGGAYIGFDADVARAISERLGLDHDVTTAPTADILRATGAWHLGLPSRALPPHSSALTASRPYYSWPSWLVVPAASPVSNMRDLEGSTICAVGGDVGAAWVEGVTGPGVDVVVDAPPSTLIDRESDEDCIDAIDRGDAAAAVTAALLEEELAARGVRAITTEPVLTEQRSVVIRGSGPDVATLRAAVDAAIAELRTSGGLAELSRRAFGGRDLTRATP